MIRPAFLIGTVLWAAALPLAAAAAARPHGGPVSYGFALAVYGAGRAVCHQRSARSFHQESTPWPVCARCTGLYFGGAGAAGVVLASAPFGRRRGRRREVPARRVAEMSLVLTAPAAATLVLEWTTGVAPGNWTRAASGALLGVLAVWLVCSVPDAGASRSGRADVK